MTKPNPVPDVVGASGFHYPIDVKNPLESIDKHLRRLAVAYPKGKPHPDTDQLLDARNVITLIQQANFRGPCTDANPMCAYQEPHNHGGFACDPSCPCRAQPKEARR